MLTLLRGIVIGACIIIYTFLIFSLSSTEFAWSSNNERYAQGNGSRTTERRDYEQGKPPPHATCNSTTQHPRLATGAAKTGTSSRTKINDFWTQDVSDIIHEGFVPNNVYYVWCGMRPFQFRHYISVLSVINFLRPDNIVFYYSSEPMSDDKHYNTWFQDLKDTYPFFNPTPEAVCSAGIPELNFIYQKLSDNGGIYVHSETILTEFPPEFKNFSFIHGHSKHNQTAFIISNTGLPVESLVNDLRGVPHKTKTLHCTAQEELDTNRGSVCVSNVGEFYPKDIWTAESQFAALVRKFFYGYSERAEPVQDFTTLAPNIAHMVWIGGGEMDFLFFTGIVSLIYVVRVDTVYIHGDLPPTGQYWQRIKDHPRLQFIRRYPAAVFGNRVDDKSHVSDVWRADLMIKYGGLYVDTDSVFIRPLDREIRGYDAVATYDWPGTHYPFPDIINLGVTIGKRNAKFWHFFQQSMKWFIDSDWTWNGLRQPYKIKEKYPRTIKIDPFLQVTCYYMKCHPTWYPDYHSEERNHLSGNDIGNWREKVYAFHWTFPTPPELENFEKLLKSDTLFAEVGRFIFEKAGMLQAENRTVIFFNGETQVIP